LRPIAVSNQRIYSIDVLRGAVMIIMALDHVRDYFHYGSFTINDPTNIQTTTPILFFTRWITHFCAPTFVFLAGISAYMMRQKKTKKELSGFLIKRGLWLILVEVLIVSLAWTFDPLYHIFILQVIWAIGISMIILGLILWLPVNIILVLGLLIICFHNVLDHWELIRNGKVNIFWEFAHHGHFTIIPLLPGHAIILIYPFLPWSGIMMVGYGMGRIFTGKFPSKNRKSTLFSIGLISFLIFIFLRTLNIYGDPSRWYQTGTQTFTLLSYLNLTKYPPSADYIFLTLGIAVIVLGLLDDIPKNSFSFLRVFGRVPFFFYVLHIYFIHAVNVILFFAQGFTAKDISPQTSPFLFHPDAMGLNLICVYLVWICIIIILFPICRKYDRYKSSHHQWWLSYL
jgi:uncharacterized membrane protein